MQLQRLWDFGVANKQLNTLIKNMKSLKHRLLATIENHGKCDIGGGVPFIPA